ncbi:tetratricopeptide repeat protein [Verrucomicrobiales bacterium]|nr:tetratricopeptide repeat protein [Verrucomicrobiales bacterium]MDC0322618.1 tetratricopeptide repeat protein [Verrucomicrobiales bacterium]
MNPFHNRISIQLFSGLSLLISATLYAQETTIPGPPPTEDPAQPRPTTTAAPINNGAAEKEDLLAYADLLYSQKQYGFAAHQYHAFLKEHPASKNIEAGWFRLGECYLQVKQTEDAEATFNHIVATYKEGIFVGSAAFRLAVLRYNAQDYKNALPFFKVATTQLGDPGVKQRAQYYLARNYQQVDDFDAAQAEFEKILAADPNPKTNPFYEDCLVETARLAADKGDTEAAYVKFKTLSTTATDPDIVAESLARAGLLAATLGKSEESTALLDQLLKVEGDSDWKSYAKVGLIFNYFSEKKYRKVLSVYETGAYDGPVDQRPKMLLIVGHCYRLTKDLDSAQDLYGLVEKNFRETTEGTEAAYSRLQILHIKKDGGMPVFAQSFVDKQRAIEPETSYIDQALLMKAEWHFSAAQQSTGAGDMKTSAAEYKSAAQAYVQIRDAKIDEKYLEPRLYKLGWSQIESGDYQKGAATLSTFLNEFPKSALATSALAKRGTMFQSKEVEDYASALADFREIVESYPEAKEVEFAMQQIALIHGHRRELPEMVSAYEALLARFPKTPGAAEAYYWIGVGKFDSDKFKEAIEPLKKAREMADERFGAKASLRIVLSYYQLDDIVPFAAETNAYLKRTEAAKTNEEVEAPTEIPRQVLTHLGMKLYDKQDFAGAETFLDVSSTPGDAAKTQAVVWKRLGECRAKQKMHQGTIDAFDAYLSQVEKPSQRASAFLAKGRAQLGLTKYEEARDSARESLRSQKEGRTNAEARLLMGDIAFAQADFGAAAREYLVLSQIYVDNELTPLALLKATDAYTKSGDAEKAGKIAAQLKADFPDFVAPAAE